jgi:hypothetical protein
VSDEDIETRVAKLEARLDGAMNTAEQASEWAEEVERENESLRQEVQDLRQELREVKQFTDLLSPTEDVTKSKETRAALALRTLWNTATNTNGIATLDAAGVADANQGEIGRSYGNEVMRAVPGLVGDNTICWIIEEDRHADDNTRVVLDLTQTADAGAAIPGSTEGVPVKGGVAADD